MFSVKRDCGHFFQVSRNLQSFFFLIVFTYAYAGSLLLFSSCGEQRGPSLVVVHGLLITVPSRCRARALVVVAHGLSCAALGL